MSLRRVVNASALVAFFFGLSKLTGLLRQRIVGGAFGLGSALDAFNVANNVPDLLFTLISGGALAIAFIPLLTQALDRDGRDALWRLFSLVTNLAFLVTAALAVLVAAFADPLVRLTASFTDPAQQRLVADLMRWNLLATLIFSISGLVMGSLQAQQHFLLPALAPVVYDLGQIAGVLWLPESLGVHRLVFGVIGGAALHLAVQIPGLVRYGFRWTPRVTLADAGVRQVLRLMGPRVVTIAFFSLIFIVNDRIASGLSAGAVTALTFGWQIMQMPQTVLGTAVGVAFLPTLADLVARGRRDELRRVLRRGLAAMAVLTAATAVAAWVLLPPAVRIVFEGGAFTADDTGLVVLAARLFMLGLVGHSLKEVTARAFYAHQDARTPLALAAVNFLTFALLGWWLTPAWGFAALAIANSASFSLEAVLMLVILRRRGIL